MDPKKYLRLKQPLDIGDISYSDSLLHIKDVVGSVMPMDTFVLMSKALCDSKQKKQFRVHLYSTGKQQSREILLRLIGDDRLPPSSSNLQLMLRPVMIAGLGEIKLIRSNLHDHRFLFRINSKFAEQYKKLFSLNKEPVDHFLAGMIAGCLEYFFDETFDVKEISCAVQGKGSCIFEAALSQQVS